MSTPAVSRSRSDTVSRALARNRLGVPAVVFFAMAGVAPLTVAAGVIPTAYATTGLTGIPAAFVAVAIVLAIFSVGYVAMSRQVTNSGAFYAFISQGLGRVAGVAAALIALLAYNFLQVGLYGALGPTAQSEAAQHLHVHASWWVWALIAWALVSVLGLARVDIAGAILGVLLTAEIVVIIIETVKGLIHPAGGHLSATALSPSDLWSTGFGTVGALAVVAVLGFVGFEEAPVLAEEVRDPRRTIPIATYFTLGVIVVVYAGVSWAMAAHYGTHQVVGAARAQGPGLLFGLGGSDNLSQAAQLLFLTSLAAAALSFHNVVWRYMFALGREHVLPAGLGRTSRANVPQAASLSQSLIGLVAIVIVAIGGWDPLTRLFFWGGTTGGFGVLILLAATSVSVVVFFAQHPSDENVWRRLAAPAVASVLLIGMVILAIRHYATLLGVAPGSSAAWVLPASYALVTVIGIGWALVLRSRRPDTYTAIGLGARATTERHDVAPRDPDLRDPDLRDPDLRDPDLRDPADLRDPDLRDPDLRDPKHRDWDSG